MEQRFWVMKYAPGHLDYLSDQIETFGAPARAWDGLRYFIVALPEPSI